MPTMNLADWGRLILLSILWGGSFFFTDVALQALPPLTIVVLRTGLAALTLWLFLPVIGLGMPKTLRIWRAFLFMGFLNNVIPFTLIVWGQSHIASGLAAILNATTPLATVLVAHFLTDNEKLTVNRLAGVALGLIGVTVMLGADLLKDIGAETMAQLAVLAAAVSYAFASIYARVFKSFSLSPIQTANGQVTASTFLMLPLVLWVDQPWQLQIPSLLVCAAVVGLACLSTALAYILYFRIVASAGSTNLMLVTFLIPVSAILLGVFVLGETLLAKHFWGMALIACGLAAIDGRLFKLLRPSP